MTAASLARFARDHAMALALGAIVVVSAGWRAHLLAEQLPYSGHMDERPLNDRALRVARSGDLNPGWFEYPSLPIYLSSVGIVAGVAASKLGDHPATLDTVGHVGQPYYGRPDVMWFPRALFILLGVGAVLLCGLAAREITGPGGAMVLAPLFCLLSPSLFQLTWSYVNVDTSATFFVSLGIWYALRHLKSADFRTKVLIPGLIAGAATASKYNSGLAVLPFLVGIAASVPTPGRKAAFAAALGLCTLVAFVCFVPYSVLDWDRFIDHVMRQVEHYRKGHKGYEADPGLDQLVYYAGLLRREFGLGACALAIVGLVAGLRRDPWKTATLAVFPIVMFLYMSTNRVHFTRTVLPAFVPVAVLMALGALHLIEWARARVPSGGAPLGVTLALAAVLGTAPLSRLHDVYAPPTDSRILAIRWIDANMPKGATILYPKRFVWDTRELGDDYAFVSFNAKSKHGLSKALKKTRDGKRYLIYPKYGFDPRRSAGASTLARVEARHAKVKGLTKLVEFGSQEVAVNRGPAFSRDPRFHIAKVD